MAAVAASAAAASPAMANAQVTIPAPFPADQQVITVMGSGFPAHGRDPTGIAIVQCSDPGGTAAGLPSSAAQCDGTTVNPLQINTDANGNFTAHFVIQSLNGAHTSNIWCDQTHYCVLWAGIDFNSDFLGVHAFSTPFKVGAVGSAPGSGSGVPATAIWLPVVLVVTFGAGFAVNRRRTKPAGDQKETVEPDPSATPVG